jgi:hypothetical protein
VKSGRGASIDARGQGRVQWQAPGQVVLAVAKRMTRRAHARGGQRRAWRWGLGIRQLMSESHDGERGGGARKWAKNGARPMQQ